MSLKYECPHEWCYNSVVIVNTTTSPHLICEQHNVEMEYVGRVETEWVGDTEGDCYQIVENEK